MQCSVFTAYITV